MASVQKISFIVLAACCTILHHVNAGVIDRTQEEEWISSLKSDQLDNDEIESLSIDDAHVDKDLDEELDSIESKRGGAGSNNAGNAGQSAGEIIAAINERHKEEIPVPIVEGDIAKRPSDQDDELDKRSALRPTAWLWQDRKIHYVFDASITASVRDQIRKAITEYENKTCLRFFPVTNTSLLKSWIHFKKLSGCWSYVGRNGGGQTISLGTGCSGVGTIIHELMHAIGFYHEQSRYDRDQNIEVFWENIPKDKEHNFNKHSSALVQLQGTVYDFDSIMQYGNKAFSMNGKDTLRSIGDPNRRFGQRRGFSTLDEQEINILYQCKKAGAGFSDWSDWSPCLNDRRTGKLFVERQKYCFETDRSLCPGANQNGVIFEKHDVTCANKTCVVDGHWSRWSPWSLCSSTCGNGQKTRTRTCTDPVPKCGGAQCVGITSQTTSCYQGRCDLGPDDCEFERSRSPTCHWKRTGSALHWQRHTGPTPSSSTGPLGDASVYLNGSGYYMYVETSLPVQPSQLAVMSSKSFLPTDNRTITFKYTMYGANVRYLQVNKVEDVSGTKTQLLRINGERFGYWHSASTSFASAVNYTIQFETQSGDNWQSDVAVDDIFFTTPGANACSTSPCKNGGTCAVTASGFTCTCAVGWTGATCETALSPCSPNPCQNGGSCTAVEGKAVCSCLPGYTGATCQTQIDNCAPNPCQNGGTCTNGVNSFTCTCAPGWTGSTCTTNINDCSPNPCQNFGTCTDGVNSFTCTCAAGWTGATCTTNINDCSPNPCQNGGTCTDGVNSFTCTCAPGWTGSTCTTNINDCSPNPCQNGGTCTDGVNSFTCTCAPGWTGATCTTNINDCSPNPCQNGGTCTDGVNSFTCTCAPGWTGSTCTTMINNCNPNPCQNGGTCTNGVDSYTCTCAAGWTGRNCKTNIDDCSPNPCQNGGTCTDGVNSFTCTCAAGWTGATCTTKINNCSPNPCQNGGTCTDGVNSFTCTCAPGWTGATCTTNIDDCTPNPCQNGGTCTDGVNSFTCTCAAGWTGATCTTNIDDCTPNPCQNGGTCTDGVNSFTCTCAPGWTGSTCTTKINNCSPNPCQNGGTCNDGVNSFTCTCAPGWTGATCATNIDECTPNPCQNGGTCTDGVNSFTCTCAAGWTGATCTANIDDCTPNPCQNGGSCTDGVNSFTCTCAAGWTGATCTTNIDDCTPNPCQNGGSCTDGINSFTCTCAAGWTGATCTTNINDCLPNPCQNGGTCTDGVNSFTCTCAAGWTGATCTTNIDDCTPNPCQNGGTCTDGVNSFTCTCAAGWTGATCTTMITPPPPTPKSTTTPPPPTTTTKAPTTRPPGNFVDLLSCDFECGFCSWKQKKSDVFDWTRQSGKTRSYYTGPSSDHTTAKRGYYLYTEASAPRKPNHNAILMTPTMQSDGKARCVDLFYHMYGSGIGSLVVSVTYNGVAHEVFRTNGNKGNKWNHGKGTLDVPSGLDFTVSIESIQGSSLTGRHWEGDTAIDDIRVWPGACPTSSSTPSVLACPIERNDFCSWTQPTTDDGNWLQRRSGRGYWWLFGDASTDKSNDATATNNNDVDDPRHRGSKGPRRALSGKQDYYAYFRGRQRSNTESAILQSTAISASEQSCMRFFAHMSGRNIGSLAVNRVDPLGAKTQLSRHTGNQKNRWFESAVTIPAGQNFKIDIVATQGRKATIAIDDITVNSGRCAMPKIKFRCDFSAGACGLQQIQDDDCDWSIVSSNGGKSLQWKANNCHGYDEHVALLNREARVPTRGGCLTVDFHLGKGDVCELEVRLLKDDGSKRGNRKRSHDGEDRIYYRKAKSRNGMKQTIRATIPPPRGGCPMKLIELEAILKESHYYYGRRCREVNIDAITFREGICGNN